jgi:hypothetical protein
MFRRCAFLIRHKGGSIAAAGIRGADVLSAPGIPRPDQDRLHFARLRLRAREASSLKDAWLMRTKT